MKIIFAGTPEFAQVCLKALLATEHKIVAVYTQPDRPAGRGRKLTPGPVKQLALEHDIPVEQPLNFKQEGALEQLASYQADLMVVVAYGLILPQAVLDTPRLGCINVHASLLPRWRGAAPIQRAIAAGDGETGITIMQMEAGLDTGPMLWIEHCEISANDTGGSLHDKLAELGGEALVNSLAALAKGELTAEPQDDAQATYANKLNKAEAQLDWQQPAQALANQIRAFNPWPVGQTQLGVHGIRVWQASVVNEAATAPPGCIMREEKNGIIVATGEQCLKLEQLQLPGKKPMPVQAVLNSKRDWFAPGVCFEPAAEAGQ